MLYQLIPFLFVFTFFLTNLIRKRRFFCVSSLVLLANTLAFLGAVFMYLRPRTGDPFVSLEALLCLSVSYALLMVPALLYKDAGPVDLEKALPKIPVWIFLIVGFSVCISLIYLFVQALPSLLSFLQGKVDRETFRNGMEMSKAPSFFAGIMNLLGSFSYCGLFLGVLLLCCGRWKSGFVMLIGGMGYAVGTLRTVSRSGMVGTIIFMMNLVLIMYSSAQTEYRLRLRKLFVIGLSILLVPVFVLTLVRFSGQSDSDEGVLYSLFSYFSTGPYCFNCDYVARTEYEVPSFRGIVTCPFLTLAYDRMFGGHNYEEGVDECEIAHEVATPEYLEISGAFSGEFKTVVGNILMDYPPHCMIPICLGVSLLFSWLFVYGRRSVSSFVWAVIYFQMLLMGPMGYAFASRYQNIMLINLILLGVVLRVVLRGEAKNADFDRA